MYKTGLVSVSFRNKTPEEILLAMNKVGLKYIEWGSDIHAPCTDLNRLNKLVFLQQKYDIKCYSYGTYFRLGVTNIDELKNYISASKILGCRVLRLWGGDIGSTKISTEQKNNLINEAKKASEIAEKENVILCLECHNGTITDTIEGALEIIKKVDSKSFQMYWQPNQYHTFDYNCKYAQCIAQYTQNVHVFNWDSKSKYSLKNGLDKWKKYVSYFNNDQMFMLEFMPDDNIETLADEANSLNKILGK